MSNQYDVLGKAPGPEDLKKLSSGNTHLTIKKLSPVPSEINPFVSSNNAQLFSPLNRLVSIFAVK